MEKRIKIADPLAENKRFLDNNISSKLLMRDFVNSENYINHPNIAQFEQEWSEFTGLKHVILTTNGTVALQLAYNAAVWKLKSPKIKQGDLLKPIIAFVVPENTYHADYSAMIWSGTSTIYRAYTYNYILDSYKDCTNTMADIQEDNIIYNVTHLYGIPVPKIHFDNVRNTKKNVCIVEDCSHAHYSKIPLVGDVCVWSCYPTKVLGALGNAGIIATNDDELAFYLRCIINQGELPGVRYNPAYQGTNARGDALQAAFLSIKLSQRADVINHRQMITSHYDMIYRKNLVSRMNNDICHYVYPILLNSKEIRDKIKIELLKKGIETGIYYPTKMGDLAKKFAGLPARPDTPFQGDKLLCLPVHLGMDKEDASYVKYAVCEAIDKWDI